MDEEVLFSLLKKQTKSTLLDLLSSAYDEANTRQKNSIFGDLIRKSTPPTVAGKNIIKKSEVFYKDSIAGVYYAPFDINSKNFSEIPEETEEWFEKLGDLLQSSAQLTKQEEYSSAVKSFKILYELIDSMESGEEIIFADEYGGWMIPGNEKEFISSYILSLSKVSTPEEYTKIIMPHIERDSHMSFYIKVYSVAVRHGTKKQSKHLKDEVEKQNIKTKLIF